jgi:hypothetical protein
LEEFPRYGGGNPKSSDFAATIINQFAEADTQNAFTSGGYRPTRGVWLIQKFIYHRGSKAVILTNGIYKNLNRECCKKSGKLAFDLVTEKIEREDTERRISSAEWKKGNIFFLYRPDNHKDNRLPGDFKRVT